MGPAASSRRESRSSSQSPPAQRGWLAPVAACLLLAVLAAYANHFQNEFHFDDSHSVETNPYIRSPANIPRFFTDALEQALQLGFAGNDLTGFTATGSQVFVDPFAALNRFSNNDYGGVGSSANAGALVQGDFNTIVNDNFHGSYAGRSAAPYTAAVLFDYSGGPNGYASENNMVAALKNGLVINGAQTCTQIIDKNVKTPARPQMWFRDYPDATECRS